MHNEYVSYDNYSIATYIVAAYDASKRAAGLHTVPFNASRQRRFMAAAERGARRGVSS
jgi:hypothetical protein